MGSEHGGWVCGCLNLPEGAHPCQWVLGPLKVRRVPAARPLPLLLPLLLLL